MEQLQQKANLLRALSIISTTEASSGHPTSCMSSADIVTVLFESYFSYDLRSPKNPNNDRFVLSKGHAAPLLYSVFALAGAIKRSELLTLRKASSLLEGHPTPRWKYAEVGTGSLGQGISVGAGIAYLAQKEGYSHKTYVLTGDGELAEGQVYEACNFAVYNKLNNLVIICDINGLGQTGKTMFIHDTEKYKQIFLSLGCAVEVIDGHDFKALDESLQNANMNKSDTPYIIVAKTVKGRGVSFLEGKEDFHGKAVKKEDLDKALSELGFKKDIIHDSSVLFQFKKPKEVKRKVSSVNVFTSSKGYKKGDQAATREVFGETLALLGSDTNIYVFDGDMSNSTYTEIFEKQYPERFIQCYIAEQNMVSVAAGFSAMGKIPVIATFGAFLMRGYDQIRMSNISQLTMKFVGSHAGISIGEDGPSQMALEDIASFAAFPDSVVLQPCDAVSTKKLMKNFLAHKGISYLRALRPKTSVLYDESDMFSIGGSKILRQSRRDSITIVASGITVFEALSAYDALHRENVDVSVIDAYSIKPIDAQTIITAAVKTKSKHIITVEDHYITGGLGDQVIPAVNNEGIKVTKLGVQGIPHSGNKDELMSEFAINSTHIIDTIKKILYEKKA